MHKTRILIVDDESALRMTMEDLLATDDREIVTAASGEEALAYLEDGTFDLIIVDMIMPGMGAGDTYDELQAIDPAIKVLLSSGYGADQQTSEILKRGCKGFIQKPFNMQMLSEKIGEILESA